MAARTYNSATRIVVPNEYYCRTPANWLNGRCATAGAAHAQACGRDDPTGRIKGSSTDGIMDDSVRRIDCDVSLFATARYGVQRSPRGDAGGMVRPGCVPRNTFGVHYLNDAHRQQHWRCPVFSSLR